MTKKETVERKIREVELELNRLRSIKVKLFTENDNGSALEVCPCCKTRNYHWYPDGLNGVWCCAYC